MLLEIVTIITSSKRDPGMFEPHTPPLTIEAPLVRSDPSVGDIAQTKDSHVGYVVDGSWISSTTW